MLQHNINAIPYAHDSLQLWRDFRSGGVSYFDKESGLYLQGVIDDLWIANDELVVVDYKATSHQAMANENGKWGKINRHQLSFYASLFKKLGHKIHERGYFVYTVPLNKQQFNQQLEFETKIKPCTIDELWLDKTIDIIIKCLGDKNLPQAAWDCDYCKLEISQNK